MTSDGATVKLTAAETRPPGLVTATGKLPAVVNKVPGTVAVNKDELTIAVGRFTPLKEIAEPATKAAPLTESASELVPAGAVEGEREVIAGLMLKVATAE